MSVGVLTSRYFAWRNRAESQHAQEDGELKADTQENDLGFKMTPFERSLRCHSFSLLIF